MRKAVSQLRRPRRVAVDGKLIDVDGEKKWLYAAINTESKLLLKINIYSRRETDPAVFTRTASSCSPLEIGDFYERCFCTDLLRNTNSARQSFCGY